MNLYAIRPAHDPDVYFVLAKSDAEALEHGIYYAAQDADVHGSPTAHVYLVAADVVHVGEARALDAPSAWEWAHPAVEDNAFRELVDGIDDDRGGAV